MTFTVCIKHNIEYVNIYIKNKQPIINIISMVELYYKGNYMYK